MKVRVCVEPGCPELQPEARCAKHRREREQARGTKQQRGYDAEYDALRKSDLRRLSAGEVLICWRCKHVVMPHEYSLGHCDDERSIIHGAEHLICNLGHTRGGCTHESHADTSPSA